MTKQVRITVASQAEEAAVRAAAEQAIQRERERAAYNTCPDCGQEVFRPRVGGHLDPDAPMLERRPLIPRLSAQPAYRVSGDGQCWPITASHPDEALYPVHVCKPKAGTS